MIKRFEVGEILTLHGPRQFPFVLEYVVAARTRSWRTGIEQARTRVKLFALRNHWRFEYLKHWEGGRFTLRVRSIESTDPRSDRFAVFEFDVTIQ